MLIHIDAIHWLSNFPPEVSYLIVLAVVGIESIGVPLPGEVILMGAGLLASHGAINPGLVWAAGAAGAVVGDSTGYVLGRQFGYKLLRLLERFFPHHVNSRTISFAEHIFHKHGVKVVFFGRFIALLRIFAGPLSGILKLPYAKFFVANAAGGILWSGIAVWTVYFLGVVAERWFKQFSWIALVLAVIAAIVTAFISRRHIHALLEKDDVRQKRESES